MNKLDPAALREALQTIPGWSLEPPGDAICKTYVFADFVEAFSFMSCIALLAEKRNHHPEWSNVYNTVSIRMTTHDAGGLTSADIEMAMAADRSANRFQPR